MSDLRIQQLKQELYAANKTAKEYAKMHSDIRNKYQALREQFEKVTKERDILAKYLSIDEFTERYQWILNNCLSVTDIGANVIPVYDDTIDAQMSK